ncbi:hypothetical protein GCM10027068_46400 [Prescottella soli]
MAWSDFIGDAASKVKDAAVDVGRGAAEYARDPANFVAELVTGTDYNERDRVRDKQADGNAERDQIYDDQSGWYSQLGEEYDDPVLGSPEAFEAMSHQEIKSAVDAMNGEALRASAEGWKKIGESLDQSLNGFRDFMSNTIKDGTWEGVAADSARAATANYAEDSTKLAAAGKLVGSKIEEAATAIDQVKATVPPVAKRSFIESAFDRMVPTAGMLKFMLHEKDEAHQEAIKIMRTVYTPVMQQSDTKVPKLPKPPQVTNRDPGNTPPNTDATLWGGGPTAHTPYSAPNAGSPGPHTGLPNGTPGPGTTPGADIPGPDAFGPNTTGQNPLAPGDGGSYVGTPNTVDTQTNPASAWTAPAAANGGDAARFGQAGLGPLGTGTGGGYAGTHGSGGGYGSGGASTGSGAGGGYSPGGFLSGGLGGSSGGGLGASGAGGAGAAATGAGGATGGAAAAAGRPGAPGGSGMMPGAGARGRGEDDNEHKTPGYLVNVDNGNELIGKLPLAAPPVIGS